MSWSYTNCNCRNTGKSVVFWIDAEWQSATMRLINTSLFFMNTRRLFPVANVIGGVVWIKKVANEVLSSKNWFFDNNWKHIAISSGWDKKGVPDANNNCELESFNNLSYRTFPLLLCVYTDRNRFWHSSTITIFLENKLRCLNCSSTSCAKCYVSLNVMNTMLSVAYFTKEWELVVGANAKSTFIFYNFMAYLVISS